MRCSQRCPTHFISRAAKGRLSMDIIFGKPKTPKELNRECDKAVRMAIMDLERHKKSMQTDVKRAKLTAKKLAAEGDAEEARMQVTLACRQTAMTRRVSGLILNMKSVQTQVKMAGASAAMMDVMRKAVKAMFIVNAQVPLPMIPRLMREFERQKETMEMKEELMNEALDEASNGDTSIEADADALMDQIYAELELEHLKQMPSAPSRRGDSVGVGFADEEEEEERMNQKK